MPRLKKERRDGERWGRGKRDGDEQERDGDVEREIGLKREECERGHRRIRERMGRKRRSTR